MVWRNRPEGSGGNLRTYILLRLPSGLLATRIALQGSLEVNRAKVVLDTGAIYTVLHPKFLERIGAVAAGTIPVRTLERTLNLPVFTVERLSVFGATFSRHPILAYTPAAFTPGIDGILSIDILRSLAARLDFASGTIVIP